MFLKPSQITISVQVLMTDLFGHNTILTNPLGAMIYLCVVMTNLLAARACPVHSFVKLKLSDLVPNEDYL